MEKSTSYSKVKANLEKIWDEVIADRELMIIKRRGKESLAVLPASELSSIMETLHLLSTPANARRLFDAMESSERGEGIEMTMEVHERKILVA